MSIEEIIAHIEATHECVIMLAKRVSGGIEGEASYKFKTEAGGEIPTLKALADELRKHID